MNGINRSQPLYFLPDYPRYKEAPDRHLLLLSVSRRTPPCAVSAPCVD